jgi:hypothetical protein
MPSSPIVNHKLTDNNEGLYQSIVGAMLTPNDFMLSLDIFPNPFSNSADIRYNIPAEDGNGKMTVFDGIGRQIEILQLNCGLHDLTLNNDGLESGIYYYTVMTKNRNKLEGKFIIANP